MTDCRGPGTVIVTGGAGGIAGAVIAALLETTDHPLRFDRPGDT